MHTPVARFNSSGSDAWPEALRPLLRESPLAHFAILHDAAAVAGCSIWPGEAALPDGREPGVIGHFSAQDERGCRAVLDAACAALREIGRDVIIGPMNGNTWRSYRFVIESGKEPPFVLEPANPPDYPRWWRAAGFGVLATYRSTLFDLSGFTDGRTDAVIKRFASEGGVIRPLDLANLDSDLSAIHELSLHAFADNFLYSPLPLAAFKAQYMQLRGALRPEFALLAERGDQLAGFVFALPELNETARGEPARTLVAKTLAVHPAHRSGGLGTALIDLVRRAARERGFTRVIHALMHDDNVSRRIGAGESQPLRRYALFAKELA